jgi:O-antigen ligase
VYSIARYGFWPIWSLRLGRPLNANLLAYLVTLAIGASFLIRTSEWIRIALIILVVFPDSRLNIATGLLIYAGATVYLMQSAGRVIVRTTILLSIGLAIAAAYVSTVEDLATTISPFARSDVTSGRTGLWIQALTKIEDSPLLGTGDRVFLENRSLAQEETVRAHDFLLETAMSYGVPAAVTAMAVYLILGVFSFLNTGGGSGRRRRHRAGAVAIIATVIPNTLFATVAWTNLADGTAVLLFLVLVPLASSPITASARSGLRRARFAKTSGTVVAEVQT